MKLRVTYLLQISYLMQWNEQTDPAEVDVLWRGVSRDPPQLGRHAQSSKNKKARRGWRSLARGFTWPPPIRATEKMKETEKERRGNLFISDNYK